MALPRSRADGHHPLVPRRLRHASTGSIDGPTAPSSAAPTTATGTDPPAMADLDPLTAMLMSPSPSASPSSWTDANIGGDDPLSASSSSTSTNRPSASSSAEKAAEGPHCSPTWWTERKGAILSEYAMEGNVRVRTRLLSSQSSSDIGNLDDSSNSAGDRYQQRLRQLEAMKRGGRDDSTREMTQKEYIGHVERLESDLRRAWTNEERVHSLKLAIQCAKLLGDLSGARYYPSMFVHVSDVLDSFGAMVFERLRSKSTEHMARGEKRPPPPLPQDFRAAEVSPEAKETCRNWFYKAACIRELLPRLYIEMAFVQCYRFLADDQFATVVTRLATMIRGIGDPLVACYCRAYLARQMVWPLRMGPGPTCRSILLALLADQLNHIKDFKTRRYEASLSRLGLTDAEYMHLLSPGIDMILKVLTRGDTYGSREVFQTVMGYYRVLSQPPAQQPPPSSSAEPSSSSKQHIRASSSSSSSASAQPTAQEGSAPTSPRSSLWLLKLVLANFDPALYASSANAVMALVIKHADEEGQPAARLVLRTLESLGSKLQHALPPAEQRLHVMSEAWRLMSLHSSSCPLSDFVAAASTWIAFAVKAASQREVLILVSELSKHLCTLSASIADTTSPAAEREQQAVSNAVESVVLALVELGGSALTSEHVPKLLDLVRPSRRVEICKQVLEAFNAKVRQVSDPILISALLEFSRTLHDSINHLSPDGERRHVSILIANFVPKIDAGTDLERALNLLVDCRAAFPNLDMVLHRLVHCVLGLAVKAHRSTSITTSSSTSSRRAASALARACLAYCHITAPSIGDMMSRLGLLVACAQVALMSQCLPQTDAFMKAAISLIPQVPPTEEVEYTRVSTEVRLSALISSLLSTLIVVPGHPDHGPFYLVQGLINALPRYQGWSSKSGLLAHAFMQVLSVLGTYSQRRLPYRIKGVESNDDLYGGAPGYMHELTEKFQATLGEVLGQLAILGQPDGSKVRQAELALELCDVLLSVARPNADLVKLLARLLDLAAPHAKSQPYYKSVLTRVLRAVEGDGCAGVDGLHAESQHHQQLSELTVKLRAMAVR